MADPLSLAASIAGLVSLSDTVFRHVCKYIRGVKEAREDITRLAQELQSFTGILRSVQSLAQSLEEEGDIYDPTIRVHHVYHCEQTLSKLYTRVEIAAQKVERSRSTASGSIVQQLKWPFSKSETKEILGELERHKNNLNLGIGTDSLHKMQLLLSRQKEADIVNSETRSIARELHTKIIVDDRRRKVLEYFTGNVNPQTNLNTNIRARHPMTGLWLTESPGFIQWLDTPGSKLWLSGIPGGGKTVLAGAVIQETLTCASRSDTIGAAFFFCDYQNEDTLQITNIVGALASQLAQQKQEAFDLLQEYYDSLHPMDGCHIGPDPDDLRALVGKMSELFSQVYVVVDGIDECGDSMDEVAEMLADLATHSCVISIAISSRDEAAIRRQLHANFKQVEVAAHAKDLDLYVRAELESLICRGRLRVTTQNLKEEIRQTLVDEAQGMFRWVACQVEYLCGFSSDFERRQALRHLPPTLHETYLRLVQRLSTLPPSTQSKIQMCFNFIAFCPERLSIVQLREAISTPVAAGSCLDDENLISEEDIAFMCGSFIRKSADGMYFEFAHFSVREFLEDPALRGIPNLEQYSISREKSYEMLAVKSLAFLQLTNFNFDISDKEVLLEKATEISLCSSSDVLAFHQLAAKVSLQLTKHRQSDEVVKNLMRSLFHPCKSSCFLLFATSVLFRLISTAMVNPVSPEGGRPVMSPYAILSERVQRDDFQPIHLAAALNISDLCNHLISVGGDARARCSFGTPFDMSIASFWQIVFDSVSGSGIIWQNPDFGRETRVLLGTGNQRLSCFEIFKHTQLVPRELSSVVQIRSIPTVCRIAFVHNDFRVIQRLLAQGISLDDSSGFKYTALFQDQIRTSTSDIKNNEQPLLELLQTIGSLLGPSPGWQLEIGRSIWTTAVDLALTFTNNPTVTDCRITLSKDALVSEAFASIRWSKIQKLKDFLADGRLDLSQQHPVPWNTTLKQTLLHFAVEMDDYDVVDLLLNVGCSPNTPSIIDNETRPPIVDCSSVKVLEKLLSMGARLGDVDNQRHFNIWHHFAADTNLESTFFELVAKRFPSETERALLAQDRDGRTPLQVALASRAETDSFEIIEARALNLVGICQGVPNFWARHAPVFGAAAGFGSGKVIHKLIEVGARADDKDEGTQTPLHSLEPQCSLSCVQLLKASFPGAWNIKFEGQHPLQCYIWRCAEARSPIVDAVVEELCTESILYSIDDKGKTLWEYYCNLSPPGLGVDDILIVEARRCVLLAWLLRFHSAMQVYESRTRTNALPLLLSEVRSKILLRNLDSYGLPSLLDQAIEASQCWDASKLDVRVMRFFKLAVEANSYGVVSIMLDNDVRVDQTVDGDSVVQFACRSPHANLLCSNEEGNNILCRILDHSGPKHLDGYGRNGRTVLHNLTDGSPGREMKQLMQYLLKKGVDINKRQRYRDLSTPLVDHIWNSSVPSAEHLLELGADPTLPCRFGIDAAMAAAYGADRRFLMKLLEVTGNGPFMINWKRTCTSTLSFPVNGSLISLEGANALHLASWRGNLDCLEFYVDNCLIDKLDVTTNDGLTPMHFAACSGASRVIDWLMMKGCHPMPETGTKVTPLHFAVQCGHFDAAEVLVRSGAKDVLDSTGISPRMLAAKTDMNKRMIQLLDGIEASEDGLSSFGMCLPSRETVKAYAIALQRAILANDCKECKRLSEIGCPLSVDFGGCPPLIFALQRGHLETAEWLLANGASTAGTMHQSFQNGNGHRHLNVIDFVLSRPDVVGILPKLVDRALRDGSGWPVLSNRSLVVCVENENVEGLALLLKLLGNKAREISDIASIPTETVLYTVINESHKLDDEGWHGTALHSAARKNNTPAARLLLDNGAVVDQPDSNGRTSLHNSSSKEMMALLVRSGASLTEYFSFGITQWLDWGVDVFKSFLSVCVDAKAAPETCDVPPLSLLTLCEKREVRHCRPTRMKPAHLVAILEAKINMNCDLGSERSLMHFAISEEATSTLVLNTDVGLESAAPFPWEIDFYKRPAFSGSMFKHFRRKLSTTDLARIAHLQPTSSWSPLCRAVTRNDLVIMENCLSLGASIDFEGSPHGSALIVAAACGNLDASRLLVRAGARLSYDSENERRSVFTYCRSKAVRYWLLVERFTEQRRIAMEPHWGMENEVKLWSGTAVVRLKLVGDRARCCYESSLEYAERLADMRKEWRGKRIPTICMEGIVYTW